MMYKEEILDLYKRPRNEGEVEDPDFEAEGENSSCGDQLQIFLKVEDGKVKEIKHQTDGCAISTAAASILTEELEGMEIEKVKELGKDWMLEMMGIDVSPMRVKCAMLGLKTVEEAIEKD